MKLLWSTLKELATKHQTLTKASKEVTERCKELHELIILQEHKINSQINDRVHQTSSTINDIINEIETINNVFKSSKNKINDGMEMDNIVQSITSSTTIDQFIDQSFTSTSPNNDQSIEINDTELLTLVQQSTKHMITSQYNVHIPVCQLDIDLDMYDSIKNQLKSCIEFIEETPDHYSRLIILAEDSISFYSPLSKTWSVINHQHIPWSILTTAVCANDLIFLFDGYDRPSIHTWFNLKRGEWERIIEKTSDYIKSSSSFDGGEMVYMLIDCVDDDNDQEQVSKVYRFNINEQKYDDLGNLPIYLARPQLYFQDNELICVDGITPEGQQSKSISVFNLTTKLLVRQVSLPWSVTSCCHDGNDLLYMLSEEGQFISVSMTTWKTTELAPLPFNEDVARNELCRGPQRGSLYYLQLNDDHNYRYSIRLNEWTKLDINDPVTRPNGNFVLLVSEEYSGFHFG
ncbi:hypothetical protein SAMD00019534_064860 [Acytostelium subglobosum LB1]|uniref:hypothetical protein n=1 Tax=Acytostelium subglobosum LB1 TaxID=1410327 RepID=UPI000644DA81|nr:hypothetical protein SAMD00019534_064860 [Acytostelium subglobosum LB1]GAM23311.1 hypothetical protein SAMD00019534_064860 [Acytostelium subglobosum LB1]|eukprot:XP_012753760.1 hypothetical protein SAMD00019534_064860 [Acytostelium subglobosum LB1]